MLVPSQIARRGDELKWWQQLNVDPLQTAQRLWQQTLEVLALRREAVRPLTYLALSRPGPGSRRSGSST